MGPRMCRSAIPNRFSCLPEAASAVEGSMYFSVWRPPFDFAQGGLTRQRSAVHRCFAALRMTKVMNTQRNHKAYSDSQPHQFPQSISLGEKCSVLSDLSTQTLACSVRWLGVTSTMTPLPLEYEQLI